MWLVQVCSANLTVFFFILNTITVFVVDLFEIMLNFLFTFKLEYRSLSPVKLKTVIKSNAKMLAARTDVYQLV